MAVRKLAFIVDKPPYKTETSRLALTHALASQSVEIYLKDGDNVEPFLAFIGDGVLNCIKKQKALTMYGVTSLDMHIRNALLFGLNVYVCKEDIRKFGLTEDMIVMDADHPDGEIKTQIIPYAEIQKAMETCDHILFF